MNLQRHKRDESMKFRKSFFICLIVILLSFTSCKSLFADPSTLLKPPKAEGSLKGIEQALNDAIGSSYDFKYPLSGEYTTPCILKDIDNDGVEEAVVLYTLKDDASIIYLNLFCKEDDKWVSISNIQVVGTDVIRVEFANLLGDDNLEILIASRMFDNKLYDLNENKLSVYKFDGQKITIHTQEDFTEFHVCDFIDSSYSQILLLSIRSEKLEKDTTLQAVNKVNAKLINLNENGITVLGIVNLDKDITEFSLIQSAPLNDSINAVFIDAYKGSGIMITELLYFKDSLVNVFYDSHSGVTTLTKREGFINSRDINNDGYIEIPATHVIRGYENFDNKEEKSFYTIWKRYNGVTFEYVYDGLINTSDGYFLVTPQKWFSNITVTRFANERLRVISLWDLSNNTIGDELVRIKVFSKETWYSETGVLNDYTFITSKGNDVFAVKINNDLESDLKIDLEFIKENLIIL